MSQWRSADRGEDTHFVHQALLATKREFSIIRLTTNMFLSERPVSTSIASATLITLAKGLHYPSTRSRFAPKACI